MTDGYQGRRRAAGAIPWLFGGALIVVAVFGIAFAVLLTGNSNPTGPSHNHKPQALAAASQPTDTTPAQSASPSPSAHKPAHKSPPASSSPPPSATSQPPSSAPPQPSNRAATVHLTATVSVSSHGSSGSGLVAFQVKDTGSAASGQVIVTITLPAGASMSSGWGGGGGGGGGGDVAQSPSDWSYGWSCQATSTGATCTHDGIAAGNQAWGAVGFTVNSGSVCGQPVDLTARSGSASAGAQSTVAC